MIETDRLILRPWLESDAEALFRYASDPDVGPRAGWPPHKDIEESRGVIRDIFTNDRTWAITLRETGEAIGCMGYFDNPASGRVMEKCGFKDTGEINWCSHLYHGEDRPVHIMKLNYDL